jgi:putative transposase
MSDFPDAFGSSSTVARSANGSSLGQHRALPLRRSLAAPTSCPLWMNRAVRAVRADVLNAAYARNPDRFVNKAPQLAALPTAVWINQPPKQNEHTKTLSQ